MLNIELKKTNFVVNILFRLKVVENIKNYLTKQALRISIKKFAV